MSGTYKLDGIPSDLLSSDVENARRFKTESGTSSFDRGRQFRVSLPLSISSGTPTVIKFVSPIDFELRRQALSCDDKTVLFQAYRSTQGSESGTFGTVIPAYKNNFKSTAPAYTQQTTITTGGGFTPDDGQEPVETIRVKTAGNTAHSETVSGDQAGVRGLAAGTYYLVFSNPENGTAEGVYTLIFSEFG